MKPASSDNPQSPPDSRSRHRYHSGDRTRSRRGGSDRGRSERGRSNRRRGGRAPRGDVRIAVLHLLQEEPMHGYQLMQAISERSRGRWTPSPGAVYPAISQLEDEGLVTVTAEAGRKVVELTDEGRAYLATHSSPSADPLSDSAEDQGPDLRRLMHQLHDAGRQIGRSGTDEQVEAAAVVLKDAKRALYLLLADSPDGA